MTTSSATRPSHSAAGNAKAFLVDGIDNTQRGGPGRLGIFSPETINEVKVLENSMAAEYGRTVGGIVSMITRGGSNQVHGEAMVLERRPALIARPSLAAVKPFQQWAVYNGNVGGPIKKDRLFYFVSGEYEPEDGPRPITITAANATAWNPPVGSRARSLPAAYRRHFPVTFVASSLLSPWPGHQRRAADRARKN